MTFAEKLRFECAKRDISPSKVAKDLGFSHGAYTYWRNKKTAPNQAGICKFADALEMSPEELMLGVDGVPTNVSNALATSEQNETIQEPILTEQEREIIEIYRAMPIRKQYEFLRAMFEISHDGGMV